MKIILFALHDQPMNRVAEAFRDTQHRIITIKTISDEFPLYTIDIAFIDEAFDGNGSGWELASKIREVQKTTKIVMLVHEKDFRKYNSNTYQQLYDWVMLYSTVSVEQILSEIDRPWKADTA